jgi:hypothetical protein
LKIIPANNIVMNSEEPTKKSRKSSIRPPNLCGVHITITCTPSDDDETAMYEIKRAKSTVMHSHDLNLSDQYKVI